MCKPPCGAPALARSARDLNARLAPLTSGYHPAMTQTPPVPPGPPTPEPAEPGPIPPQPIPDPDNPSEPAPAQTSGQ